MAGHAALHRGANTGLQGAARSATGNLADRLTEENRLIRPQPILPTRDGSGSFPRLLSLDAHGHASPAVCRSRCEPGSPFRFRSDGALEIEGDAMALSRLLRRARDRGHACMAVSRPGTWPATLRCRRLAEGYQLELCLPEDVLVDHLALCDMFALTPTEAAVATALCDGLAPADLAARLGVQVNTVQAHIKRTLAKTGCRRQAELVALLLRSAACGQACSRNQAATRPPIPCVATPIASAAPGSPGGGA